MFLAAAGPAVLLELAARRARAGKAPEATDPLTPALAPGALAPGVVGVPPAVAPPARGAALARSPVVEEQDVSARTRSVLETVERMDGFRGEAVIGNGE